MEGLTPHWFKPGYQPDPDNQVELHLRPADMRTLYVLQTGFDPATDSLSWAAVSTVFEQCVIGWRGYAADYSPAEKRKILSGTGDPRWVAWLSHIASEVYRKAILGETEIKN